MMGGCFFRDVALSAFLCLALNHRTASAFVTSPQKGLLHSKYASPCSMVHRPCHIKSSFQLTRNSRIMQPPLQMVDDSFDEDDEISILMAKAAQLRAEAAKLEAEKAQSIASAAEKAFKQFDTDNDGEISLEELKKGLEKNLKVELSDKRVKDLMAAFDASGDGKLQQDEFVGVNIFRNKLESLVRDEKESAKQAAEASRKEEEAAKLAEARVNFLNEKLPTSTDKVVSVLPYLFPLLDSLQYARFLLTSEDGTPNPIGIPFLILYTLYRKVPFSGFVAFFAINFLSGNPKLNRLIRFNSQQAIFLDIALIFPGLIFGIAGSALPAIGVELPKIVTEVSSDATFVVVAIAIIYCTVSSLLGVEPNKLPYISQSVDDRMPTLDMFDEKGGFVPRDRREGKDDEKDDDSDKKK